MVLLVMTLTALLLGCIVTTIADLLRVPRVWSMALGTIMGIMGAWGVWLLWG